MKILIATPQKPDQVGGPSQYAGGLQSALTLAGHHVSLLSFDEVDCFPSGIRHFVLFWKAVHRLRQAEAVIILDTISIALPTVLAATLMRKKVVIRTGGDFLWEHYVERTKEKILLSEFYISPRTLSAKERFIQWLHIHIVLSLTDKLVFSTTWQRDLWFKPYQLSQEKISVIENAYHPHEYKKLPSPNPTEVAWLGRDIFLKNVATLDTAMMNVSKMHRELVYKKYSGLAHHEVLEMLKRCRFVVVPSLSEVSPNLVLEALALGVPVLLTKDCGLKQYLDGVVTWIDPRDVGDITEKISRLMTDSGYESELRRVEVFTATRTYAEVANEFVILLKSYEKP